ncbi:bifunctional UDP-2,4-diacetamido-2,4,6-trideoxy-beta-L-altropyranose hydrolase/GNAT family N-acetyltransferase [Pseudonocardia parietis]|uniref:Spore coat polysaccharide biosynthesis predicted glycosyltransferase SpsG/RimJ/RimL family protein N-acetyltransferase n=1 Tax=Pseudonocardia parietis TaxID=570936 RepID=A0ABS4VL69_9PSEU|nr:bifunctional UDP-2,4-diacetamido-2,4,6-trideoxy-beta-L-altropyranose hydrolase/GNAT family N-acetyltransferase [Pseudonocardia parietis]MBP2364666.1 spore coat polysaccharide biosynthesis predicted glycosyltransferase SpsG/RimJ/RimL family protein N-acetyltransferase [Pseudonocardia parietis]
MRLLLRCDAGPSTGVGHAVRCAAVAEAARSAGHEVFWSGRLDGLDWLWAGLVDRDPAAEAGPPGTLLPPAASAETLVALCREHRIDAVHVDHYLLGDDLRPALNAAGVVLSTVEDFATGRRPGNLVIDPNLGAADHPRPDDGSAVLLRGPGYAPLRTAARRARRLRSIRDSGGSLPPAPPDAGRDAPGDSGPPRVLVVMGGTDAAGLLPLVVAALDAAGAPAEVDVVVPAGRDVPLPAGGPARFRAIAPLPDLPAAMVGADLVVSAAGTTVWELCCVGVPMALVRAADNQAEGYRTVVAAGAAAGLGGVDDLAPPEPAAAVLRALLTDPARRDALAARARTVVDGEGANRIVAAITSAVGLLREAALHARPAVLDDAEMLLTWRNDPETRRWSRSTAEIDLDAHRRWLAGSLDRDDRLLIVVSDAAGPVGTVRWDHECSGWEVSITVSPQRRGSGLAVPLLRAGEEALRARTGARTPVTAVVHADNAASARLFARAGYADDDTGPDDEGFRTLRRTL